MMRRFQRLQVGEPSKETSIKILKGVKHYYESHHGCKITDEACEDAVGDGAGDVGDAPHHHIGSDHPTGNPGQGPRHQRVLEELEFEDSVEELHQCFIR